MSEGPEPQPIWKVPLPKGSQGPYQVFVNGVPQQQGADYELRGHALHFRRPLAKEGKLGLGRWFLGAFGIGTYRQNDSVDVSYMHEGRERLATGLDIIAPPGGPESSRP